MVTLTGDIAGTTGLIPTKINSVDFFEYVKKHDRVVFHIGDDKLYATGSLKFWVELFHATGYKNFMIVDRNKAVNLNNIKVLDPVFKKAYFDYKVTDKVNSGCSMSWDKFNTVKEKIGVCSPNAHIITNL